MPINNHSTQFFAIQRYRKKMSLMIFGLFLWVVVVHALVLLILFATVGQIWADGVLWAWWFWSVGLLGLYFLFAASIHWHRIKHGGQSLARQLGAIRLFLDKSGQDDQIVFADTYIKAPKIVDFPSSYARFYEFAEQMSLASGVPCPKLYVLAGESAINGFVAGYDDHDMVLVLTQGAVERLNNEALYALIGHEFGHILHGDAQLNLRLYILMAGLSLFYECADWLEELLLGKFHANYHGSNNTPFYDTHQSTVRQFANEAEWATYQKNRYNPSLNARAGANVVLLPVMGILVWLRIIGVFGMESIGWLKSKFNHQRELLADATSMQLTRSFGMVSLLTIIKTHDTALYTTKVSAMDYFFFANPNNEQHLFMSHPAIDERLLALTSHAYDELGLAIVSGLDLSLLKETHDHIARHAPVHPLKTVVEQTIVVDYHATQFEPFVEIVENGRLVVDDQWRDWSAAVDWSDNSKQVVKTENLFFYPFLQYKLTHKIDLNEQVDQLVFPLLNELEWGLAKYLKQPLGLIVLLEMVLLCRFEIVKKSQEFDLIDIFVKLPDELPHYDERVDGDKILPHSLNAESFGIMASQHRLGDVALIVKILATLPIQLKNNERQFKMETVNNANATLNRYMMALGAMFGVQISKSHRVGLMIIDVLWQGTILAGFCHAIKERCQLGERLGAVIVDTNLWHALGDLEANKKAMAIALVGVLMIHKQLMAGDWCDECQISLNRWYRLVGIEILMDDFSGLMDEIYGLSVIDWASVMWHIGHATNMDKQSLHTALLYDNKMSQKEQGIVAILEQF